MRARVLSWFVIGLVGLGCGGGEFSGGSAGAPGDDAAVGPDGSSGHGGSAGAGGTAGQGGSAAGSGGTAGSAGEDGGAGAGGALDASADAEPDSGEAGVVCPGEQKLCDDVCVDTSSNPSHCGDCGQACPANQVCQAGGCVSSCTGTTTECSGACVELTTDLNNCGQCGVVCEAHANQTPSCVIGQCAATCNAPWVDCDNSDADGCESNLDSDPSTCGSCANACSYANAKAGCENGACILDSCNAGFGTCDGNVTNGCETDLLNDANNCGDCNIKCAPPNGVGICSQGKCALKQCTAGYADCDGNLSNGCEIKTSSDVFNCGACGRDCLGTNVEAMMCEGGVCVSSCDTGFGNCNMPAATSDDDGCETTVKSQKLCGSCSNDCSSQGASPFACLTPSTSPHCGCASAAQCGATAANTEVTCSATGLCKCSTLSTVPCRPGEFCKLHSGAMVCTCNAGGPCGTLQTCCANVGCVDVTSDPKNCGGCGHACAPGFTCSAGKCACAGDASCNAGSVGTCSTGVCSCAVKCATGQRCLPGGTCG